MFFPFLIHLTGVSCPLFELFPFCQVLPPFSTGVPPEIVLTLCAILSIVPEAVYCCFHQVSPHLVKFMFNSFRLQSECSPNYIILNPSLTCFNRSVFNIHLALQPRVFSQCSLSLFSNGVFSTLFTFVVFFSRICSTSQGSLVSLVCQRSNLVLPLLFLFRFSLRCHSRSRDEILSQWWSVVTPRDRCARCLPVIRWCCHVFCLCVAFHHAIICIASSCFQNQHPSGFPRFSLLSVPSPDTLARARGMSEILFYKWPENVLGMG